ncbi:Arv1-like family protein [Onchocerca flexuosa]|uniref:Protein ARV n=1 Tax=Onchocerca flexuosa TaxID=387005 RepID=A0A238BMD5_9BILA|nr:Arv1-like family protein [Onchocerca flexuosa]
MEKKRGMRVAEDEYICINCCHPSSSLFLKYSDNGIRLTPCSNCGKAVDVYIEYDIVLVIIDLMLQYIGAYRHFLMNTSNRHCHKLCIIFMLCDAYSKWIRQRIMSGNENAYDLEWKFYECLLQSWLEMASFMIVLTLLSSQTSTKFSINKMVQTFCVGSYGNVFAVLSIIWHLHLVWSYRMLTELFVFISHVQTQRALCSGTLIRSILVVLTATVVSRSIGLLMDSYCFI